MPGGRAVVLVVIEPHQRITNTTWLTIRGLFKAGCCPRFDINVLLCFASYGNCDSMMFWSDLSGRSDGVFISTPGWSSPELQNAGLPKSEPVRRSFVPSSVFILGSPWRCLLLARARLFNGRCGLFLMSNTGFFKLTYYLPFTCQNALRLEVVVP